MDKKEYLEPELKIRRIDFSDIIVTSNKLENPDNDFGDDEIPGNPTNPPGTIG